MRRFWTVTVAALMLGATAASAAPYYYPGANPGTGQYPGARAYGPQPRAARTTAPAPDAIVRQGIDRLKGFMARGGAAQPPEIKAFLNREISPYFDFNYMAKWAGGATYQRMNEEQRRMFSLKLKSMFFSALARNLGTYSNTSPRIDVSRPRARGSSGEVDVMTRVQPDRGYPVKLTFRFYRSKDGWKVFDVTANGTSAVAYYRKYFNQAAREGAIEACCR